MILKHLLVFIGALCLGSTGAFAVCAPPPPQNLFSQQSTHAPNLSTMTADQVNITGGCINGVDVRDITAGGAALSPANPSATAGPSAVTGSASTFMRSDAAPAIQKGSDSLFGILKVDGTTVTASGGVISAAASTTVGNPTALIGMTATNGAASSALRSDGAPAIDPAIAPTWTQPHAFNAGYTSAATNPTVSGASQDRWLAQFSVTYDNTANIDSNFSDANGIQLIHNFPFGMNSYLGGTNAKWTAQGLQLTGNYKGAGQRFNLIEIGNCWGNGDCFGESRSIGFWGADISGDEGQGFQSVSYLNQGGRDDQAALSLATISGAPVRTTCSTTVNQGGGIVASGTAQAVTVTSAVGCTIGDWIVVNAGVPNATPNYEAVHLTGVSGSTITGIFRTNQSDSATITPAVKLTLDTTGSMGQGRYLIDVSATPYTTGTVSAIAGGALTGSGTTWTTSMVGDDGAPNIGCIALTADDYTGAPFNSTGDHGTLHAYYAITSRSSNTAISIFSFSTAGDASYHNGKWTAASSHAYKIYPCAEVLQIDGNDAILMTSAAPWTSGHSVEQGITPFPDVSGYQYHLAAYTPGGNYRRFLGVTNTGARSFDTAIEIVNNMRVGGGADTSAFLTGITIGDAGVGINLTTTQLALQMAANTTSAISWGAVGTDNAPINQYIGYTTVGSQAALLMHSVNGTSGAVDAGSLALSASNSSYPWAGFQGNIALAARAVGQSTKLRFYDGTGDPQASTSYADIRYVDGNGNANSKPTYWMALTGGPGVVFTGHSSGADVDAFVVQTANSDPRHGVIGLPQVSNATNGANKNGESFRWQASIWDGAAARAEYFVAYASPEAGTDAHFSLEFDVSSRINSYNFAFPGGAFAIRDDGKLRFGLWDAWGSGGGGWYSATIDPTALTTDRIFALPDQAGEMAITTGTKTTGKCLMFDANGLIIVATVTVCS